MNDTSGNFAAYFFTALTGSNEPSEVKWHPLPQTKIIVQILVIYKQNSLLNFTIPLYIIITVISLNIKT